MYDKSIIDALRHWLTACPTILRTKRFGVDNIAETEEFAIISSPSTPNVVEDITGKVKLAPNQTQNFIFANRMPYGKDIATNLDNLSWWEETCAWIQDQNYEGNFPLIQGLKIRRIIPTLSAYPAQTGTGNAVYQIQIAVSYTIIQN